MADDDALPDLPSLSDTLPEWIRSRGWLSEAQFEQVMAVLAKPAVGSPVERLQATGLFDDDMVEELEEIHLLSEGMPGFRAVTRLGGGQLGAVYEAEVKEGGTRVALKFLRHVDGDDEWRQRFEQHAAALAELDHPAIPKLLAHSGSRTVGDMWGSGVTTRCPPFMAVTFIDGLKLTDLINRFGNVPEKFALRCIGAVARAVAHVHERTGIVHGDIKPGNIVVDEDDPTTVRLMDFGLGKTGAQRDGRLTATFSKRSGDEEGRRLAALGDPHYVAPELVLGHQPTPDVDQYSLGACLFHLLTGRPPFDDLTPEAIAQHHLNDQVPDPRSLVPTLEESSSRICLRAMSKDPARRFPSMLALAEACDRDLYGIESKSRKAVADATPASGVQALPEGVTPTSGQPIIPPTEPASPPPAPAAEPDVATGASADDGSSGRRHTVQAQPSDRRRAALEMLDAQARCSRSQPIGFGLPLLIVASISVLILGLVLANKFLG